MKKNISIIYLLFISSLISCQINSPTFKLYGGGSAGIGETKPYWNFNNQYAKHSLNPFEGIIGFEIESLDSSDSFISFDYGLEMYDRMSNKNDFIIHQAYAEIKSPYLNLWAGKREEIIGNQDSILSIGSTVWSRNARPMPIIEIGTPGYIDFPFTKGYLEVNGSLSHGWFENDRYVEGVYLHQKHLHLRFGGDFFINASLGLIHFAQWGGTSPNPNFGALPSNWDAYKRVFFVQNGDSTNAPIGEVINKLGNHLGSRTYRIDIKPEHFTVSIYYQTLFEDGSGLAHEFYRDGLGGISFKTKDSKLVNHLVFEFLQTAYQSGPTHNLTDSIKTIGNDNYFNNGTYRSGWTYHNMIIGSPLITSPIYYENTVFGTLNNRVLAIHLGIGGILKDLNYRSFFTYSINKGTYKVPIDPVKQQFSWYFETTFPSVWKGIDLNVMFAADIGQMYGNNLGVILLLRKTFNPFH